MAKPDRITLADALDAGNLLHVALWFERRAIREQLDPGWAGAAVERDSHIAALLQAAATYRLVVAQEQTAYLLQRLVDAAERGK